MAFSLLGRGRWRYRWSATWWRWEQQQSGRYQWQHRGRPPQSSGRCCAVARPAFQQHLTGTSTTAAAATAPRQPHFARSTNASTATAPKHHISRPSAATTVPPPTAECHITGVAAAALHNNLVCHVAEPTAAAQQPEQQQHHLTRPTLLIGPLRHRWWRWCYYDRRGHGDSRLQQWSSFGPTLSVRQSFGDAPRLTRHRHTLQFGFEPEQFAALLAFRRGVLSAAQCRWR